MTTPPNTPLLYMLDPQYNYTTTPIIDDETLGFRKPMASLTGQLTDLICKKSINRRDLEQASLFIVDAAANIIAGINSDPGRRIAHWAINSGIIGREGWRADSGRYAFVLGSLCHIHEVDDLHRISVVHPGCVVIPAVLAVSKCNGNQTDGRKALTAVLHGFEATTRLGAAVGPAHYRIWHNTSTCGPFGSAFAAATLLNLTRDETIHALGNAGTQSFGLWEFLKTGAMSKHIHAGRASEAGVVSAELAQQGFTGAPEILEGERGFFVAMCPGADPKAILNNSADPWQLLSTSLKPWPSCRHTHPSIDAAQEIRRTLKSNNLDIESIESVKVEAYDAALALCDTPDPDSLYDAKFSLQHCVAAALSYDQLDFSVFEKKKRFAVADLRRKITVRSDNKFNAAYPDHWGSSVSVRLKNGVELEASRETAKGDPEAPLTHNEIVEKAQSLMKHGGLEDPNFLIDGILEMPNGNNLPELPISELIAKTS